MNLAEQLFCSTFARAKIEDLLEPYIPDHVDWELTWDYYDESIELHHMPPDWRMPVEVLKKLFAEGFQRMWVNYEDKSEIYYTKNNLKGCKQ